MIEQFGKYALERKLAVGGMAEIFLATHQGPEGFKKHVAIKRVLAHLSENADFVTMFLDEARLVARFNHPNIVQIFELGEVDGVYFLSMEFVNGRSVSKLSKACRKQQLTLPVEYAAKIVSHACEGLDYAHNFADADGTPLALIHRDVSPQNLMLSYDGVVKVLDFGIAKAAGNIYQTRTSSLKGKAAYMSPEQITQKGGLDRRSDIFSLGIVLYELVAGRRPFGGDTELELMMSIVQKRPPDPRKFNETLPEELTEILRRALAKDREERYQSCREMRQSLEQFIMGRGMLVDNYVLGSFMRELVPPGDTGVGFSMQTPSHPSQLSQLSNTAATTPAGSATNSSGRSRVPLSAGAGEDAPTQLTPSGQIRPLLEAQAPAPDSRDLELLIHAPTAASRVESTTTDRPSSWRWSFPLTLVLVLAIGAGVAFLLFGDEPSNGSAVDAGIPAGLVAPVAVDAGSSGADAGLAEAPDGGRSAEAGAGQIATAVVIDAGAEPDAGLTAGQQGGPELATAPLESKGEKKKRRRTRRRRVAPAKVDQPPRDLAPADPKPPQVAAAQSPGQLVVDTRPWTSVSIDGTSYGTTPIGPVDLKAGMHRVVLVNRAKGIKSERSIRVLAGQTHRVQEKFGQGLLQVFVKPFGEVFVNGVSQGMTPLGGPIKLYEGTHSIRVHCNRTAKTESKQVQLKPDQTVKLIFDLR